jgi:pyoverdine/dityrosine biosynthesis protein Dit1
VFSDVVGMKESNVTAYQDELSKMIREMVLGFGALLVVTVTNIFDINRSKAFLRINQTFALWMRFTK